MAYVVRRPGGRWEVRQSYSSDAGPRARTLATFKLLTPLVIERAARKAKTPMDTDRLIRSARRAGVEFERSPGEAHAVALLGSLIKGDVIRPGLCRLLLDQLKLGDVSVRSVDDSVSGWLGASLDERGAALIDLLDLGDRLPNHRSGPLRFPGLSASLLRQ